MLNRIRIGTRLLLALGIMSLALAGVALSGRLGLRHVERAMQTILGRDVRLAEEALAARVATLELRRFEKDFFLNLGDGDAQESYLRKWTAAREALVARLDALERVADSREDRDAVAAMREELRSYEGGFGRVAAASREGRLPTPQAANAAFGAYKDAIHRLEATSDALTVASDARVRATTTSLDAEANRTERTMTTLAVVALGLVLLVGVPLSRSITGPILDVVAVAQRIAAGDLRAPVTIVGRDETADLKTAIRAMAGKLADDAEASRHRKKRDELVGSTSRRFLDEDLDGAMRGALEGIGDVLGARRVGVFARDEGSEGAPACTHAWNAPSVAAADRLAVRDALPATPSAELLVAPVSYGGRQLGVLAASAGEARAWSDDDATLLHAVGDVIAIGQARRAAEVALAKAKEDAIAASDAKSAFLANMSHELRTPLNGVIGMVDLLGRTELDERQRHYANVVRSSANLLLSVINDILDFSKIEANKLEIERVETSLAEIVEEAASVLALHAEEKGLDLCCSAAEALRAPLIGDPARIRQVVVNLVSNAIKFTRAGEVSIWATVEKDHGGSIDARVEVRDTGIGIPREALAKLFQPFSQVDASTTREHQGSGLGLAICRELVERMGGRLGVRSEPGQGSTFWFLVPLARGPEARPVSSRVSALAGLRVLCVDDNATNREILLEHLGAAGMVCRAARDALAALDELRAAHARGEPFDLAVLDHHMPGIDGVELARRIKAEPALSATRLVMLGSVGRPLGTEERRREGIVGYASKPLWRAQLLRVLCGAMDDRVASSIAPAAIVPTAPPADGTGATILLVEDSAVNAEVASELLRLAGYRVDLVTDGEQAIGAARARAYDLVLMDCQLPVLDGYEATRAIRAIERDGALPQHPSRRAPIPIVALTASVTKGDVERCLAAGMNDYVSKPIDTRRLLAVLASRLAEAALPASPSEPRVGAQPVMDLERALSRVDGNTSLLDRIRARFVADAPATYAKLADAVRARDVKQVAFEAHRLRGQAVTFEALPLVAVVEDLEAAAKRVEWSAIGELLPQVQAELGRLARALA